MKVAVTAVVVVVGALLLGGGIATLVDGADNKAGDAAKQAQFAKEFAVQNRENQIRNCEISKKPGGVRFILADVLRYYVIRPEMGTPKAKQKAEDYVHQLLDVSCPALYPAITSP